MGLGVCFFKSSHRADVKLGTRAPNAANNNTDGHPEAAEMQPSHRAAVKRNIGAPSAVIQTDPQRLARFGTVVARTSATNFFQPSCGLAPKDNDKPAIAQLAEHLTVDLADIRWSLVRFRVAGFTKPQHCHVALQATQLFHAQSLGKQKRTITHQKRAGHDSSAQP